VVELPQRQLLEVLLLQVVKLLQMRRSQNQKRV
jgi:hypothetical protein